MDHSPTKEVRLKMLMAEFKMIKMTGVILHKDNHSKAQSTVLLMVSLKFSLQ